MAEKAKQEPIEEMTINTKDELYSFLKDLKQQVANITEQVGTISETVTAMSEPADDNPTPAEPDEPGNQTPAEEPAEEDVDEVEKLLQL